MPTPDEIQSNAVPATADLHDYHCATQHTIRASALGLKEAARVFATRRAKQAYGRKGYCVTARMEARNGSMTCADFAADIGYDQRIHGIFLGTSYRVVRFTVFKRRPEPRGVRGDLQE